MQRSGALLVIGGAALAALALSRTESGAQIAADAVGFIDVNARKLLPRGLRNNNPGNLRYIARNPWDGQIANDGENYGVYLSMEKGVRAAGRQLLKYGASGRNTVRKIISTWAPSTENETEAYISAVAKALKVHADAGIDVNAKLEALATAIFRHEVGAVAFAASPELTAANIRQWVRS